jgi:hypothetical protein
MTGQLDEAVDLDLTQKPDVLKVIVGLTRGAFIELLQILDEFLQVFVAHRYSLVTGLFYH